MDFVLHPITSFMYRVALPYVSVYYLQGRTSGLLVDTGWGYGDLKAFVDCLATTDYTTVLTHGHCDHGGGAIQFDPMWLHPRDWTLATYSCSLEVRQEVYGRYLPGRAESLDPALWLPQRHAPFLPLAEGQIFDLGGLSVQVFLLAGHSPGSVVLWILPYRWMILGDACADPTLMSLKQSTSIAEFHQSLVRVEATFPQIDRAFNSHDPFEIDPGIVTANRFLAWKVLNHEDDQFPVSPLNGEKRFAARNRKDTDLGDFGNIIYTRTKLPSSGPVNP